jgi:TRAP-type mannitol/chloroaromatic compound transport system permease small subunit
VIVVVVLALPRLAVIVAVSWDETVTSVAVNEAESEPAGMITLAGTVSSLVLLAIVTVVARLGTATVRATVQVEVPPVFNEVGVQVIVDNCAVA